MLSDPSIYLKNVPYKKKKVLFSESFESEINSLKILNSGDKTS